MQLSTDFVWLPCCVYQVFMSIILQTQPFRYLILLVFSTTICFGSSLSHHLVGHTCMFTKWVQWRGVSIQTVRVKLLWNYYNNYCSKNGLISMLKLICKLCGVLNCMKNGHIIMYSLNISITARSLKMLH
jgi:hypothetical protein